MKQDKKTSLKERKWFRTITNKYFIIGVLFGVYILFIDNNSLLTWGRHYAELIRQERIIRQYQKDINSLDQQLEELKSDSDSLEKFTREQFYFHKKNEEVFLVK